MTDHPDWDETKCLQADLNLAGAQIDAARREIERLRAERDAILASNLNLSRAAEAGRKELAEVKFALDRYETVHDSVGVYSIWGKDSYPSVMIAGAKPVLPSHAASLADTPERILVFPAKSWGEAVRVYDALLTAAYQRIPDDGAAGLDSAAGGGTEG